MAELNYQTPFVKDKTPNVSAASRWLLILGIVQCLLGVGGAIGLLLLMDGLNRAFLGVPRGLYNRDTLYVVLIGLFFVVVGIVQIVSAVRVNLRSVAGAIAGMSVCIATCVLMLAVAAWTMSQAPSVNRLVIFFVGSVLGIAIANWAVGWKSRMAWKELVEPRNLL